MTRSDQAGRLSWQEIARRVAPDGTLEGVRELYGAGLASMHLLGIRLPDGSERRVVVRRHGGKEASDAAKREFRLLQCLSATGLPVPGPLLLDPGDADAPPAMVLEYVDGDPTYAPEDGPRFAREAGRLLAQIHGVDVGETDVSYLPVIERAFAGRLKGLPQREASTLDEPAIQRLLEPFWTMPLPGPLVLVHGDLWPGNLIWRNGEPAAVIDWEDACVAHPLADLAVSRLDTRLIFGHHAMEALTAEHARASGADLTLLPYWDLCAALRAAPAVGLWAGGFHMERPDLTVELFDDRLHQHVKAAIDALQ